jgi:hypothetical protein
MSADALGLQIPRSYSCLLQENLMSKADSSVAAANESGILSPISL